ncbi:hypothetical protein LQZ19_05110 [Treponema primitia]|uniref:hypothetical protein n=1 Tax=Treponema primitia TaxID=88058 RepID=UPI00397FA181
MFIDLDEGMQLFQDKKLDEDCKGPQSGDPGKIKILQAALDELDKRDSLAITYGVHIFIQYIEIAIGYATNWLIKINFDNIKRFLYSVPKFKTENADILDGITVRYAEGFFIALLAKKMRWVNASLHSTE